MKIKWNRLDNGNRVADGLPVLLRQQGSVYGKRWHVRVPTEPVPDLLSGWDWTDAYIGDRSEPLIGDRLDFAQALVEEHLEEILRYAVELRSGWPHADGHPAGKYISNYGADGSLTYTGTEPPTETPKPVSVSWDGPDGMSFQSDANKTRPEDEMRDPVPSTPLVDELRQVVVGLDLSIAEFRASIPKSVDVFIRDQRPEQVRDTNGRPILGDWLAAKANALAALANLEASR